MGCQREKGRSVGDARAGWNGDDWVVAVADSGEDGMRRDERRARDGPHSGWAQ